MKDVEKSMFFSKKLFFHRKVEKIEKTFFSYICQKLLLDDAKCLLSAYSALIEPLNALIGAPL